MKMRVSIPVILESAEELERRLSTEKRARLRERLQALWMLKSGQFDTREAVADALGVHRHTITRWLTKYRRGGLDELLTIRTRPNRQRVVPARVMRALEEALRSHPEQFASFRDVQSWITDHFGLNVKYKTIYRLVRYELGIRVGKRVPLSADRTNGFAEAPAQPRTRTSSDRAPNETPPRPAGPVARRGQGSET
jgi:transposase